MVGVTTGSIYAIAACGLVVTYTTSGIFNFAQGAMGMFSAFVYWQLKVDWGIATPIPALIITVLRLRAAVRRRHRAGAHAPAHRRAARGEARGDDRSDARARWVSR